MGEISLDSLGSFYKQKILLAEEEVEDSSISMGPATDAEESR